MMGTPPTATELISFELLVAKLRSSRVSFRVFFVSVYSADYRNATDMSSAMSSSDSTKEAVLKLLDEQQRPFSLADISEKVKELGKSSIQK